MDDTRLHSSSNDQSQHLVLIGGGHAHVQVIRALHSRPPSLRVTLIDQQAFATYSGMVPGCIAGTYENPSETQIDIAALAEWSGIEFRQNVVMDIDVDEKVVYLQDEDRQQQPTAIPFDVVSLDVGSTTRGWAECPGAAEWTIPTRPIHELVHRLTTTASPPTQLVVLGGGMAGLELSLAAKGRWPDCHCVVLDAAADILPGEAPSVRATVRSVFREKGVEIRQNCRVARVEQHRLHLEMSSRMHADDDVVVPFSHCIWATGAGPSALLRKLHDQRGLACDSDGWVQVSSTLQSTSHPHVFAAGDCASVQAPKAGVYAVRAGPTLLTNLTLYLRKLKAAGEDTKVPPLIPYVPQDDFLKLVVCGDGTALGIRYGLVLRGPWVFRLKDAIDHDFLELFRVEGKAPSVGKTNQEGYEVAQYDDTPVQQEHIALEPREALALLLRTDDDVDFRVAQRVLKRMQVDEAYRTDVLNGAVALIS